jgi:hypothetical protein
VFYCNNDINDVFHIPGVQEEIKRARIWFIITLVGFSKGGVRPGISEANVGIGPFYGVRKFFLEDCGKTMNQMCLDYVKGWWNGLPLETRRVDSKLLGPPEVS